MMAPAETQTRQSASWASVSERGSRLGLRMLVWFFQTLGDGPVRLLLAPIASYYCLFATNARKASRAYLVRLRAFQGPGGRAPGWLDTYRHFHSFAEVILDRFSFWADRHDRFEVAVHGEEAWYERVSAGRGAILIGAHLGSFDALRVLAREAGIPVNVLMYTVNAPRINEVFEQLDPNAAVRVINVDPNSVRATFEIRQCLARGEFVAVLGDRVRPGGRKRIAYAPFLGERAPFPIGPFLLPMVLRLPALMVVGLKTGPRSYDIFLEPLWDGQAVARSERAQALQDRIEFFATKLEFYCGMAPLQWFNFYDFWAEAEHERP